MNCRRPGWRVFRGARAAGGHRRGMRSRAPGTRFALVLVLAAGVLALAGCYQSTAGDVRLRSASMVDSDQDMRMNYDTPSALRNAPP